MLKFQKREQNNIHILNKSTKYESIIYLQFWIFYKKFEFMSILIPPRSNLSLTIYIEEEGTALNKGKACPRILPFLMSYMITKTCKLKYTFINCLWIYIEFTNSVHDWVISLF